MAKPTTESIALPDFPVTIVRNLDGNFIHNDISLKELVQHTDKGLILYFYPKDSTPGAPPKQRSLLSILMPLIRLVMTSLAYRETALSLMRNLSINTIYRFH